VKIITGEEQRRRGVADEAAAERDRKRWRTGPASKNGVRRQALFEQRGKRRREEIDEAKCDQDARDRLPAKPTVDADPFEEAEHHRLRERHAADARDAEPYGGPQMGHCVDQVLVAARRRGRERDERGDRSDDRDDGEGPEQRRAGERRDEIGGRAQKSERAKRHADDAEEPMWIGAVGDRAVGDQRTAGRCAGI
jgi:hypothetical protein